MENKQSIQEKAIQDVIKKAWEDEQYKEKLMSSPKKAIKELTGLDCPEDVNIVVVDQTDSSCFHLNIPPQPDFDNLQLTDEQLEAVAGGELWAGPINSIMATCNCPGGGLTIAVM